MSDKANHPVGLRITTLGSATVGPRGSNRAMDHGGFTIIELLIAMAVLAMIAVALSGISIGFLTRLSDDTRERQADATTAQWASVIFARDVQGAVGTSTECSPDGATRLLTLRQSGATGRTVEYRVTSGDDGYGLVRVDCSTGDSRTVVRELVDPPTVTCDSATCVDGTNPRMIELHVSRRDVFGFQLDGARRVTDGNLPPDVPPTELPALVSLTGSRLKASGSGRLEIHGDAYLNAPTNGTEALRLTGSTKVSVSGELRIEDPAGVSTTGTAQLDTTPGPMAGPFPDPLRHLPAPDTSGLPIRAGCTNLTGNDYECEPGIYTSKFPPSATGQKQFVLQPGVYVLRNGMSSSGGVGITTAGGVLLYLESGSTNVSGSGELALQAQNSGTYAGILFFQPRSNTSSFSITGSSSFSALNGLIYAPATSSMNLGSGTAGLQVKGLIGVNMETSGSSGVIIGED